MTVPGAGRVRAAPLALLGALYLVQGLPYGLQAQALGVYLRQAGVSLTAIGFSSALAAPWLLKPLWAPLVDRHFHPGFGRRRSWIVPMQALLALTCLAAAAVPPREGLLVLLALVLLMNLFAATMDIAVDGLAVDMLSARELGAGNAIQVVGYKVGMLLGGGVLVWLSARAGWSGLFVAMALVVLVVLGITVVVAEPGRAGARASLAAPTDVLRALREALRVPGTAHVLLVVGTYKIGEALVDPMFAPFLVDLSYTRDRIGLWVGTYGMAGSIAGSLCGGLLASRAPLERALAIAGGLRALPLVGIVALAVAGATPSAVIAVTIAEHFFGGALTTVMFAFMMSRVDRRIGASHYTFLAAVEVLGKSPFSLVSGALVDRTSYPFAFGVGLAAALAWSLFLALVPPPPHPSPPAEPPA